MLLPPPPKAGLSADNVVKGLKSLFLTKADAVLCAMEVEGRLLVATPYAPTQEPSQLKGADASAALMATHPYVQGLSIIK